MLVPRSTPVPNHKIYSCVKMAYLDFTTKPTDVIDSLCPSKKKIRLKSNTKPWFDSEVISVVNKRGACYKKFKAQVFQDKLQTNSKHSKELWKTLKSLGLKS